MNYDIWYNEFTLQERLEIEHRVRTLVYETLDGDPQTVRKFVTFAYDAMPHWLNGKAYVTADIALQLMEDMIEEDSSNGD